MLWRAGVDAKKNPWAQCPGLPGQRGRNIIFPIRSGKPVADRIGHGRGA